MCDVFSGRYSFDIVTCDVWCYYSWPLGFLVKFIPVPQKQFQPNFNVCCGWGKRRKPKESEILDGIDSNPRENQQTNGEAPSSLISMFSSF